MFLYVVQGIFTLANTFIAICIVVYALLFLKKTKSHKERRPWDYLFVASVLYLFYTLLTMLLTLYHIDVLLNLGVSELSIFFQFLYTGLILLAFISQTDLIFKNELIIITRKLEPEQKNRIAAQLQKEVDEERKNKEKPAIAEKPKLTVPLPKKEMMEEKRREEPIKPFLFGKKKTEEEPPKTKKGKVYIS
jgi:hypothetical protein